MSNPNAAAVKASKDLSMGNNAAPTRTARQTQGEAILTGVSADIAVGLKSILSVNLALKAALAADANNAPVLTWGPGSVDGAIKIYAWKHTSVSNPTLIAATASVTVSWQAHGA